MQPVSGSSSSSSAAAARPLPIKSDKDEKQVADPLESLLESCNESASIEQALAIAAGIMRLPGSESKNRAELMQPLTQVALLLIQKDSSLALLQTFLENIQKSHADFQGVDLLALLLVGNNTLVTQLLRTAACELSKLPAMFRAALALPQVADSISELDLENAQGAALASICKTFPRLRKVALGQYVSMDKALEGLVYLEELSLAGSYFDRRLDFKNFRALTTFECKDIERTRQSDYGARQSPTLLERLLECPKLHTLRLERCHNGPYPVMPEVRNLTIHGDRLDGAGIKAAFPALQILSVDSPDEVAKLDTIPTLRELHVRSWAGHGRELALQPTIRKQPQLSRLTCSLHAPYDCANDWWLQAVDTFQSLGELTALCLELDWNARQPIPLECFAKMASNHPKLQEFTARLQHRSIEPSLAATLAPLKQVPKLRIEHSSYSAPDDAVQQQFARELPHCTFAVYKRDDAWANQVPVEERQKAFLQVADAKSSVAALASFVQSHNALLCDWMGEAWNGLERFPLFMKEAIFAAGHSSTAPVTSLDLTGSLQITDAKALVTIAHYLPRLESIKLIRGYTSQEEVDALARCYKLLKNIELYDSAGSGEPFKKVTFQAWAALEHLSAVTILGEMSKESLDSLIEARPNLRSFAFGQGHNFVDFLDSVARLERLETLNLKSWWGDNSLYAKLKDRFTNLRVLCLSQHEALTQEHVGALAGKPQLVELHAKIDSPETIPALGVQLPALTTMKLYDTLKAETATALGSLPGLRVLHICVDCRNPPFKELVAACPLLEELHIVHMSGGAIDIAQARELEKLRALKKITKLGLRESFREDGTQSKEIPQFEQTLIGRGCQFIDMQWERLNG